MVTCNKCKYHARRYSDHYSTWFNYCIHPIRLGVVIDPVTGKKSLTNRCEDYNSKGDCKLYKRKWYRLW